MRSTALYAALAVLLASCATEVYNPPTNEPVTSATAPNMGAPTDYVHENSIVLAFSGGGLRAAAFAYGVLTALDTVKTADGTLLDDVAMINSVSGSSLTAAYYGLFGREGLARYRQEVLVPGFEDRMRMSPFNPENLARMIGGGVNAREDFRDALDASAFHGATFSNLYSRAGAPRILIQATDLYHRVPFPFMPDVFEIVCSDLSRYSIADAVAGSMAVPILFAPMIVRTFPDDCRPLRPEIEHLMRSPPPGSRDFAAIDRALRDYRDPSRTRYIKLGDGGLTDNFAVSTIVASRIAYGTPYAPLTEREAVKVRRLLLIVVDAARRPASDWTLQEAGPSGLELMLSATDVAVEAAARQAADALGRMVGDWQAAVIKFRCGLTPAERIALGAPAAWNCADVKFSIANVAVDDLPSPLREKIEVIPTRLSLEPAEIDAAVEGAREGTLKLPGLKTYLQERTR